MRIDQIGIYIILAAMGEGVSGGGQGSVAGSCDLIAQETVGSLMGRGKISS